MICNLLKDVKHDMNDDSIADVVEKTRNFSGADLSSLCQRVALVPVTEMKVIIPKRNVLFTSRQNDSIH